MFQQIRGKLADIAISVLDEVEGVTVLAVQPCANSLFLDKKLIFSSLSVNPRQKELSCLMRIVVPGQTFKNMD